jgi:hypothetical protein
MAARVPAYNGSLSNPIQRQVPRKYEQFDSAAVYEIELADTSKKQQQCKS